VGTDGWGSGDLASFAEFETPSSDPLYGSEPAGYLGSGPEQHERLFAKFATMETVEVDGCLLGWEADMGTGELTIGKVTNPEADRRPRTTLRLEAVAHRMRISLNFRQIRKSVDVSVQPSLFEHVLPVGRGPCRPGTAGSTVARWVAELAGTRDVWRPPDPDEVGLVGTAGGAAFPVLGAAYDRGAAPLGVVPPWATSVLSKPTLREAAVAAFDKKANRRVVAALGSSLSSRREEGDEAGPVTLYRLALALIGAPFLEPDRIARILDAGGPQRPADAWPDAPEIAAGRQLVARMAPAQAERLLIDAIEQPEGPTLLCETLRDVGSVLDLLPERPPHRLEMLRNQCRALLPVDPDPGAAGWRRPPGAGSRIVRQDGTQRRNAIPVSADPPAGRVEQVAAPRPRRGIQQRGRALIAPEVTLGVRGNSTRAAALLTLNRCDVGDDLRIAVPRSLAELSAWGLQLRNCVGSYGAAFVSGQSLLIGIKVEEVLTYCLEVTPQGRVRQFLGVGNRPVPRHHARLVCGRLAEAGVLDPSEPANRVWLQWP